MREIFSKDHVLVTLLENGRMLYTDRKTGDQRETSRTFESEKEAKKAFAEMGVKLWNFDT
jgi:hypothetical protein